MNGRYAHAETPEARIAIAAIAANNAYFKQFPDGVAPGQVFLEEFLKPFVQREIFEARLFEMHAGAERIAPKEKQVEFIKTLIRLRDECTQKMHGAGGD